MPRLRIHRAAFFSALLTDAAHFTIAAAGRCYARLLAAMHESRAQEAARIMARYAHLTAEADEASRPTASRNHESFSHPASGPRSHCRAGIKRDQFKSTSTPPCRRPPDKQPMRGSA